MAFNILTTSLNIIKLRQSFALNLVGNEINLIFTNITVHSNNIGCKAITRSTFFCVFNNILCVIQKGCCHSDISICICSNQSLVFIIRHRCRNKHIQTFIKLWIWISINLNSAIPSAKSFIWNIRKIINFLCLCQLFCNVLKKFFPVHREIGCNIQLYLIPEMRSEFT